MNRVALSRRPSVRNALPSSPGRIRVITPLFNHYVFGAVALGAAVIHLLRPSLPVFAVSLAAAGFGIVLHNPGLSALAVAVLILSLARPVPAPE